VLDFVRERVGEGLPPTVREVQAALGFRAVETAREHLERLVAEGKLEKDPGVARGYRVPGAPAARLAPVLGRVPAGPLAEALEAPDGYVRVETAPHALSRASRLFALRVQGDSMTGAGILDGDIVIVRAQATANDGEIVVARIGGEATVKRLRVRRNKIELHPENDAYEPIEVGDVEDFTVLGRVIEVRRYYAGSA
jgi:repressor LexA